jgi:hypothetical protein
LCNSFEYALGVSKYVPERGKLGRVSSAGVAARELEGLLPLLRTLISVLGDNSVQI